MNTKITFFLLLILLVILLLFYYIDLESNIIILLAITIVVLVHNLISKKEHFNNTRKAAELDAKIDVLLTIAKALQSRTGDSPSQEGLVEGIEFDYSCPINMDEYKDAVASGNASSKFDKQGIDIGIGTTLNDISADELMSTIGDGSS